MRYKDAPSAIDWLCTILGFQKFVVYEANGIIIHAQLRHGTGIIMLSSKKEGPFDELVKIPNEIDNINTQSCYICIKNLEEHYKQVKDSGAEIVLPLKKEDHGAGYTCRDPEGYLWSFGDYDPFDNDAQNN